MPIGKRKKLIITERQARVSELYHTGLSMREVSERLKAERPKDKHWAVSITTIAADLNHVQQFHLQQAVDSYSEWVAKELSLSYEMGRKAEKALEASKKIKKEKLSLVGNGAASEDTITTAGDADWAREVREWQNQRIKLIGIAKGIARVEDQQAGHGNSDDEKIKEYEASILSFAASVAAQSGQNAGPDRAPERLHPSQAHPAPSIISAP